MKKPQYILLTTVIGLGAGSNLGALDTQNRMQKAETEQLSYTNNIKDYLASDKSDSELNLQNSVEQSKSDIRSIQNLEEIVKSRRYMNRGRLADVDYYLTSLLEMVGSLDGSLEFHVGSYMVNSAYFGRVNTEKGSLRYWLLVAEKKENKDRVTFGSYFLQNTFGVILESENLNVAKHPPFGLGLTLILQSANGKLDGSVQITLSKELSNGLHSIYSYTIGGDYYTLKVDKVPKEVSLSTGLNYMW